MSVPAILFGGCGLAAGLLPSKQATRVRLPSPARLKILLRVFNSYANFKYDPIGLNLTGNFPRRLCAFRVWAPTRSRRSFAGACRRDRHIVQHPSTTPATTNLTLSSALI